MFAALTIISYDDSAWYYLTCTLSTWVHETPHTPVLVAVVLVADSH